MRRAPERTEGYDKVSRIWLNANDVVPNEEKGSDAPNSIRMIAPRMLSQRVT